MRKKPVVKTDMPQNKSAATASSIPPAADDDVIGKTKIVYLENPEVARKTPTRSEPLEKEPIEEDEEIRPDDVIQEDKSLTEEEREELMASVDTEPDPDFDTAMTFEDISNVADVLMSENPDEQKAIRAASTIHHKMQDTVILSFLTDKLSNQEKVHRLLSEMLGRCGQTAFKRKPASPKKEVFDINKYSLISHPEEIFKIRIGCPYLYKSYFCNKLIDYGSDKSDIGKMDGGAKASPPFGQAGTDGAGTGSEPRQARQDRQPQAGGVESPASAVHRGNLLQAVQTGGAGNGQTAETDYG